MALGSSSFSLAGLQCAFAGPCLISIVHSLCHDGTVYSELMIQPANASHLCKLLTRLNSAWCRAETENMCAEQHAHLSRIIGHAQGQTETDEQHLARLNDDIHQAGAMGKGPYEGFCAALTN